MINLFDLPVDTTRSGFVLTTSGVPTTVKANLTATADPTAADSSASGYSVGSTWINVTLDKVFVCVDSTSGLAVWNYLGNPTATAYPSGWSTAIGSTVLILQRDDASSVDGIDPMSQSNYNTPIASNEVAPVLYGYFNNTGSNANGAGHGIGCLGRSQDSVNGKIDLIGVEGRIDGYGSQGIHQSFLGITNLNGMTFAGRAAYGLVQRIELRESPDTGAPVNEGVCVSVFCPSIVGGDPNNKWSFYGNDPVRTRGSIRCFNSDDSNQIVLTSTAFDTYIQSTTKIRVAPLSTDYLILEDCLGFIPLTNARKLGDGSLSLNWQVHASSVLVNNTQVVSTRKVGWTAATGTATRTSFATGSVTLPNLAQAVKALIDDLISHGLIGT